eukprot:10821749-Karenia_brevis.AAC.1
MDYAQVGDGDKTDDSRRLLIGRDKWTSKTFSHLVQCKGVRDEKVVRKVLDSIKETGYTRMQLKTDGEPALVEVQEKVKELRTHETLLVNPPAYDPSANGVAEKAVDDVKCQLRVILLALEHNIGCGIDPKMPILEWMIPHA